MNSAKPVRREFFRDVIIIKFLVVQIK